MKKRLSEKEKKEISKFFISGKTIEQLSSQFNCSKLTISRNIKKDIGLEKYDDLIKKNKNKRKVQKNNEQNINRVNNKEVIGEITIVIKGIDKPKVNSEFNEFELKKELNDLINAGLSLSKASKYLAKKNKLTKGFIYNLHYN